MTQSNSFLIEEIVTGLAGACLAVGLFIWLFCWDRRRRHRRGDRTPMTIKLLRPAGYGLMIRKDELLESAVNYFAGLFIAGGLLGVFATLVVRLMWSYFLYGFSLDVPVSHPRVQAIIAVLLFFSGSAFAVLYLGTRCWQLVKEAGKCRLGLRGEQAVCEALLDSRVLKAGYRSFHDVPGDGDWNLDHVVVGAAGLFVLETKARTKRPGRDGQPKHQVGFNGSTLSFPTWEDHETARQVERNAKWLRTWVEGFGPKEVSIHPVIVIPGWYVTADGNHPVKAMNSVYLPKFIEGCQRRYSDVELRPLIRRLDERCRTLEF